MMQSRLSTKSLSRELLPPHAGEETNRALKTTSSTVFVYHAAIIESPYLPRKALLMKVLGQVP